MAEPRVQAELDQAVEDCAKQPLDKPDVWLLQRACLLAQLAERVYHPAQITHTQIEADVACAPPHTAVTNLTAAQSPETKLQAKLLCGPVPGLPVHAVWEVQKLGVVAVFRGTASLQDVYADIGFSPVQLSNSDIRLHGGIHGGAAKCVSSIQAAYNKASQHCSSQNPPALYLAGHSLGGGYALCAFLEIVATSSPLSTALMKGGSYTFGAPLVAYKHDQLEITAQAVQLLLVQKQQLTSGWSQVPMFNFVNGFDIIPRLLGQTDIHTFAQALVLMLPQSHSRLVQQTASVAGNFVPMGTYCLMLGNVVRVVDCAAKPELLQLSVEQLLGAANQMSQHDSSAPFVLSRALSDHCCTSYVTGLQTAAKSMVPVLFMGGQASDYQPILVQRQFVDGFRHEVVLRHVGTGLVSHSAFKEVSVRDVLTGIGAAAVAGIALKEASNGSAPMDMLTKVKAVTKSLGSFLGHDAGGIKPSVGLAGSVLQANAPIGKALTAALVTSVGGIAASPALGVVNLAASLLNLGLTGYNTYQLRGITKLQKVMNDKLSVADSKLDTISGELRLANTHLVAVSKGQDRMDEKLDWIMRSNTEISHMCDAVMDGVGQLESMLYSQAHKLEAVVGYCQALQQDQQILLQGQDVFIRGQRVMLQEILDLHQSVLSGSDTLAKELQHMSMDNLREKVDVVTGLYMDLLKVEGTQARQANLEDRACQLQACVKTWLHKIAPSTAERVAIRQPFVVSLAIAAIAWDTANNVSAPVSNGIVFLDTGMMTTARRDQFAHRREVIKQIDAEIAALMQLSTLFSFATTFNLTMARYVYLRRALQGRTSIDELLPLTEDALPAGSVITYDAQDLMWIDGLDDLRAMVTSAVVPAPGSQLPVRWKCCTLDQLQWYCMRKGLPLDSSFHELPYVYTFDLLRDLGVPDADLKSVAASLTVASIPILCKAVLPQFVQDAVAVMASQLPHLQLPEKMSNNLLFAGSEASL